MFRILDVNGKLSGIETFKVFDAVQLKQLHPILVAEVIVHEPEEPTGRLKSVLFLNSGYQLLSLFNRDDVFIERLSLYIPSWLGHGPGWKMLLVYKVFICEMESTDESDSETIAFGFEVENGLQYQLYGYPKVGFDASIDFELYFDFLDRETYSANFPIN